MALPPKSQKFPLLSIQVEASARLPGTFVPAGVPIVPYIPKLLQSPLKLGLAQDATESLPPTQVHSFGAVICAPADRAMPAKASKQKLIKNDWKLRMIPQFDVPLE
jgi:hypothetical protein